MMALRNKQKKFVEEYLKCWNASEAARLAGYSPKTAGSIGYENLKKPEIAQAIKEHLGRVAMDADEVLERLGEQARSDMGRFMGLSEDDLRNHPQSHLIKEYERIVTWDKEGNRTERLKIKLYDGQTALLNIGKHHRLFTDQVDLTSDGKPILQPVVEAMKDLFQEMGKREKLSQNPSDGEEENAGDKT